MLPALHALQYLAPCPYRTAPQVLGDRSLMYKYINPNTLLVLTGTSAAALAALAEPEEGAAVTALLVDTVTGAVRASYEHQGCAGPVSAVAADNWYSYTMTSLGPLRTQVRLGEGGGGVGPGGGDIGDGGGGPLARARPSVARHAARADRGRLRGQSCFRLTGEGGGRRGRRGTPGGGARLCPGP
jgi:hypothetical protein